MNHKQLIHQWIQSFQPLDTIVDMTAGNGHDTFFLSQHANHVIAVDIQEQAINNTKLRCSDANNITYLNQSNADIDFNDSVQGLVYNLGYLPGSDKTITTSAESTLQSLRNALPYVTDFITLSCYRKHEGGNEEYLAVKHFIETHFTKVEILEYETTLSPVTFLIKI